MDLLFSTTTLLTVSSFIVLVIYLTRSPRFKKSPSYPMRLSIVAFYFLYWIIIFTARTWFEYVGPSRLVSIAGASLFFYTLVILAIVAVQSRNDENNVE